MPTYLHTAEVVKMLLCQTWNEPTWSPSKLFREPLRSDYVASHGGSRPALSAYSPVPYTVNIKVHKQSKIKVRQ